MGVFAMKLMYVNLLSIAIKNVFEPPLGGGSNDYE